MANHNYVNPLITTHELQQLLTEDPDNLTVIDARFDLMNPAYGAAAYIKERIPTSLRIELEKDICSGVTATTGRHPLKPLADIEKCLQKLGINQESAVVIYDDKNSMFAIHIWWVMSMLGHQNVQVLNGGLTAWQADGYGLETDVPREVKSYGDFTITKSQFGTVSANDIMQFLKDGTGNFCIVDARGEPRYRGEVEPLDPVAGHIPTAINRPFELNLNEDGKLKCPTVLKAEWEQFLENHTDAKIVHQCGSGVSGCHNLFAMVYAGLGATMLYPGSWSEWCKDSNRPIAKG